jgi:hypothetical protein
MELLLNKGANHEARDIYGFLPVDYADANFDETARDLIQDFVF